MEIKDRKSAIEEHRLWVSREHLSGLKERINGLTIVHPKLTDARRASYIQQAVEDAQELGVGRKWML